MQLQFIEQYRDEFSRAGRQAGETLRAYAERIIARLDAIQKAVENDEEFTEERRVLRYGVSAGTTEITSIGAGNYWEIEAVTPDAAATIEIQEDGELRFRNIFANASTVWGCGAMLHGPGTVQIVSSASTTVSVQFKMRRRKPTPRAIKAGSIEHRPIGNDPRQDPSQEGRHANPAATRVNGRG